MNVLIVYPEHPSTPHVMAVRAWRFATGLSDLGHRTVFLTGVVGQQQGFALDALADHDWRRPLVVTCRKSDPRARTHSGLRAVSRAVTAWSVLLNGGRQREWPVHAWQAAAALAESFPPSVVWSTFGSLEAVLLAKRIAARCRCPWVLDVKDSPEQFIPAGLRTAMAWRTRGWSALTANAQFTAGLARNWQGAPATIVYSGVDEAFLKTEAPREPRRFAVNLVGSVYPPEALEQFLIGLQAWIGDLTAEQRAGVVVRYLGAAASLVHDAVGDACRGVEWRVSDNVPIEELARLCRGAAMNAYIASPRTFHHKLLELLACGPPVMAVPRERDESTRLAQQIGGTIVEAADAREVARRLGARHADWLAARAEPIASAAIRRYSWLEQTKLLESCLFQVVAPAAVSSTAAVRQSASSGS